MPSERDAPLFRRCCFSRHLSDGLDWHCPNFDFLTGLQFVPNRHCHSRLPSFFLVFSTSPSVCLCCNVCSFGPRGRTPRPEMGRACAWPLANSALGFTSGSIPVPFGSHRSASDRRSSPWGRPDHGSSDRYSIPAAGSRSRSDSRVIRAGPLTAGVQILHRVIPSVRFGSVCAPRLILVQTGPGMLRRFSPQAMARHDADGLFREARYVIPEPEGVTPFGSAHFSSLPAECSGPERLHRTFQASSFCRASGGRIACSRRSCCGGTVCPFGAAPCVAMRALEDRTGLLCQLCFCLFAGRVGHAARSATRLGGGGAGPRSLRMASISALISACDRPLFASLKAGPRPFEFIGRFEHPRLASDG